MSDTQGTWKGSAPFGTGWNADVVEAVGSDLEINNGTIDVAAITADTLWGNPQTIAAKPTPVAIGPGLTLPATGTLAAQWQTGTVVSKVGSDLSVNSGTIDIAAITAASLFGNPGTAAAKPSAIAIGSGLTLSAVGTLSNTGILSLVGGTNVTITGGNTISATGGGGSGITSLVIGSGLSPAGTISSGGTTVSLGTIAASSLMGNAGTVGAVPGAIAVGTNLTLSAAGTLSASAPGTGTVTQVATSGAGIAGGPITGSGTLTVEWNGGTVNAITSNLAITSNTLDISSAYATTLNPRQSVVAATAAALAANTYSNGTAGVGATLTGNANGGLVIDGQSSFSVNDAVLVKNEATASHNGVYLVTQVGGVSTPYILTRAPNFNTPTTINGTGAIPVINGATNQYSSWFVSAGVTTIGTDAVNFTQLTNALGNVWNAGTVTTLDQSLLLSGGVLSVGYHFSVPLGSAFATTNILADATGGNMTQFQNAETIYNVYWPLATVVNGGSYIAQICPLNGSNVVQSVNTSGTIVSGSVANRMLKFSFGAGVVVSAGTTYAISCSRLDGGTTFALPLVYSGSTGRAYMKNTFQLGPSGNGIFQNTVTTIVVGTTLTNIAAGFYGMGLDKTF